MKPVIKKQQYYSILLMRDDASVRTLRVRDSTGAFLLALLALLVFGGGFGIWGGLHYWKKYDVLSERHKQQERELSEARLQLERYVNYDTLLEAANGPAVPLAKNEEIGATAPAPRPQNATQPESVLPVPASRNATMPQSNGTMPASALVPAPGPSIPLISSGPLRVNDFSGRMISPQRLRIRYELATAPSDEQRIISGAAKYFIAFTSGAEMELPVQDVGDARFSISRMKLMEANLRLPQSIAGRDISQIFVFLELDGGSVYREAFPVSR